MSGLRLDAEAFEALVVAELDLLPDEMVDGLENVVFVVEDRPEDGSLDLLGLYDGIALTERDRCSPSAPTWTSSATRCTPRSCTRSVTTTGSTTRSCTGSAGPEPGPPTGLPGCAGCAR